MSNGVNPGKNEILFVPLGGAGEIGMNMSLYGTAGQWLAVDCGVAFADENAPGVDLLVPDPAFAMERRDKIAGIVITHAHEDHIGAVPYLWRLLRRPVYASRFACAMLERKLQEAGLVDEVPVHEVTPGRPIQIGPFSVEYVNVTHSIPEAHVLAIRTAAGLVVHATDWKLDPAPLVGPPSNIEALQRLGAEGVLAMTMDSTNVFVPGEAGSEATLRESLTGLVGRFKGRVAIACFASNVARVSTIAAAAKANGRSAAVVGRSMIEISEAARRCGYLADTPPFLSDQQAAQLPRDRVVFAVTGSQGEPRSALARIAAGEHNHVKLGEGDTVIFSSKIIPGNEKAIGRLENQLARLGIEVIDEGDHFVHVSGHPGREELARMYGWIKPRIAVPIHGEARHLHEQARFARECGIEHTAVIENGAVLRLTPNGPEVVERVRVGRLAVDGTRLIPLEGTVMTARKRVGFSGAAVATVVLDGKGRMVMDPKITVPGLMDEALDSEAVTAAVDAIVEAVEHLSKDQRRSDGAVGEAVRAAIRRTLKRELGKRPVTEVHVMRL